MTHLAPGPPGEMPLGPQRTIRSFERPPPALPTPAAASSQASAVRRVSRVRAWCIGGAVALVLGGGAVATVLYLRKRKATREARGPGGTAAAEPPFADFNDPVELRPRAAPRATVPT
jgi:hypothetical protein